MMTASYESELARTGRIVFTVRGVSMRPLFHEKTDVIVVESCDPAALKSLDIVLHTRPSPEGTQYVLHRIVGRRADGRFVIAGDNCVSADLVRPKEILGIVTSAQRRNVPIRLSGIRYALYKNLWCRPYRLRFTVLRCRSKARSLAKKIVSVWRR